VRSGSKRTLRDLEDKAAQLDKKGLKLQPHVIVLADSVADVGTNSACYACLHSSVYFCTSSLMEAVDICVKASFVFGLDYPHAAQSCWAFIQRAVYAISHRYDRLSSKVQELLTDIQ